MAEISELDRDRASDEATAWLIRLQEEPDDRTLRAQFEAWRAASQAHASAWSEVAQSFALIGEAMSASDAKDGTQPLPLRRPVSRRAFTAAAALALAACLALVFLPGLVLRLDADYATASGEWREVKLADGSVVDLAPQSAIKVVLAGDRRFVSLLAGQAFFEVMADATRPFQVDADGVRTTVLGTAFDIRLERRSTEVAVRHGMVRVDDARSSRTLQAGDWVRVASSGQVVSGRENPGEIGAWRQGQLVAHDRPISQVVDALRPYFDGMIVVTNDALGHRRVTGVYTLRDPIEALQAVGRAHDGITVTRVLPWLVIVSGG